MTDKKKEGIDRTAETSPEETTDDTTTVEQEAAATAGVDRMTSTNFANINDVDSPDNP
jgi:hypothetical protein